MTDFKQHNPFKVPKGYFEKLEEELCNSEDSISKLNPFSTPEYYFEDLEKTLVEEVAGISTTSKRSSNNFIYSFMATAAAILILIGLFEQPATVEIEKEQALNDFIESYYLEDFDSYEMLSMMEDNEIESPFDQITKP
jgi:hypothetical protein|tara:strand:+ start:368 stop:781 length:414 start_codon:yes stop_codon:yes gene_type:complete